MMTASEIRERLAGLRRKTEFITPTLDRELLLFCAEMLAEAASQLAEMNEKLSKEKTP